MRTHQNRHGARAPVNAGLARALADSQGFTVESTIGRIGIVEAIRFAGQPRRPIALVVRTGGPDRDTIVLVPVASIETVVPETREIRLRRGILLRRSETGRQDAERVSKEVSETSKAKA